MPHLADIAKALTQLTKKDKIWDWNQECQESFDKLKSKLRNTRVGISRFQSTIYIDD